MTHKDYEFWKHLVGAENTEGKKLTAQQLRSWANNPDRKLECVSCQVAAEPSYFEGTIEDHVLGLACPKCGAFKEVLPHIPGWSEFD